MNKVTEKLKDLFYDNTDYIIIILIVLVVSGVIVWRLDSLFHRNNDKKIADKAPTTESVEDVDKSEPKSKDKTPDDLIEKEKRKQKGTIVVDIPAGSLPETIANILLQNEVITDKFEFLKKSQEMGLETKFKSGEFEFHKDESVEDVIRKVTKQ